MKNRILILCLLIIFIGLLAEIAVADSSPTAPVVPTAPNDAISDSSAGKYKLIGPAFDTDSPHSADFDSTSKSVRSLTTAVARETGPLSTSIPKFTLIRVAPFSGTNPFDYRAVRAAIDAALTPGSGETPGGGTLCTPGVLSVSSGFPVIPPADAYLDVDAVSNGMTLRDSGSAGSNTALTISLPAMDITRFTAASGWQAVTPTLPRNYPAGAGFPPVSFVLKRTDSGDFYSFNIGFIGTSTLAITSASGSCCGQGGCP